MPVEFVTPRSKGWSRYSLGVSAWVSTVIAAGTEVEELLVDFFLCGRVCLRAAKRGVVRVRSARKTARAVRRFGIGGG
jgi:hypothetical protein